MTRFPISIALAAFALLVLPGCVESPVGDSTISTEGLSTAITSEVEPGATLNQIRLFLRTDGATLGLEDPVPEVHTARELDEVQLVNEHGLSPDQPVYSAILREQGRQLTVVFVLDGQLRFEELIILEYSLGLQRP